HLKRSGRQTLEICDLAVEVLRPTGRSAGSPPQFQVLQFQVPSSGRIHVVACTCFISSWSTCGKIVLVKALRTCWYSWAQPSVRSLLSHLSAKSLNVAGSPP